MYVLVVGVLTKLAYFHYLSSFLILIAVNYANHDDYTIFAVKNYETMMKSTSRPNFPTPQYPGTTSWGLLKSAGSSYFSFPFFFLIACMFLSNSHSLSAQEISHFSELQKFNLGEVEITGYRNNEPIPTDEIKVFENEDAAKALSRMNGVNYTLYGNRGESSLSIRGVDLRGVPVFIDGIPVYSPYDGYLDLSNMFDGRLFDVAVKKGFTPGGLTVNSLGGAINFISYTPSKPLEIKAEIGAGSGKSRVSSIALGSKFGKVYFMGSYTSHSREHLSLSSDFDTVGRIGSEDGGFRDNSYYNKKQASLKIGFMPNELDEYALHYFFHSTDKGTPPYTGFDENQRERFWQWPAWKKNSLYFIGNKRISATSLLKFRFFYDDFYNQLDSYDDNSYTTQFRGYAFSSIYDDFSLGSNAEFTVATGNNNLIRFNGQIKRDNHTEYNIGEPERDFEDLTYFLGAEHVMPVNSKLRLIGSAAYIGRNGLLAQYYNPADSVVSEGDVSVTGAPSFQALMVLAPTNNHKFQAGVYRKVRLATMKERYSYRIGYGIPNPNLIPEKSLQGELSYYGSLFNRLTLQGAVFYHFLTDAIITKYDTITSLMQSINRSKADQYGIEVEAEIEAASILDIHLQYAMVKTINISDPELYFTHIPEHAFTGQLIFSPIRKLDIQAEVISMTERFSTSYGTLAPEFAVINAGITYSLTRRISFNFELNNILDRDYAFAEGFPEPGRNVFASVKLGF